jgi:hypothetical protein
MLQICHQIRIQMSPECAEILAKGVVGVLDEHINSRYKRPTLEALTTLAAAGLNIAATKAPPACSKVVKVIPLGMSPMRPPV